MEGMAQCRMRLGRRGESADGVKTPVRFVRSRGILVNGSECREGDRAMMTVKAKFDGRVFVPEEPVNLPVGYELEIAIETPPAENGAKRAKTALQELVEI